MAEIDLKVNEKECKQIEADSHNTTSQLVDLLEGDANIGNDSCKKESNENIAFEENLMCLVKNSKHSKMKEELAEETVSGESTQPVVEVEESGPSFPSESLISERLLQSERDKEYVSNKAWQKSGIGSELQTPDLTLYQICKPPHEGNTWKICSPREEAKLDSEKSEVMKETAKKLNRKESSEDFAFKVNEEEHQVDIEPPDDKKHTRISSNSGNAVATSNKLRQYSRDELLTLMSAPVSRAWPEYFDIAFKKPEGKMDLEKWVKAKQEGKFNGSSSISVKSVPSGAANSISSSSSSSDRALEQDTKRTKDPRERIKQELHGGLTVVLSPQRKSFSTGCHVTQQSSLNIGGTECNIDRSRELPVNRRIGSGRIARREDNEQLCQNDNRRRDHRDNDKDVDQRRDHKSGWRTKNENIISSGNNRFDREDRSAPHIDKRRRFFDDDDDKRNEQRRDFRDSRERRYNNNNNHRRNSVSRDVEEEAPEWFTGGPSSQNEYIELVGFDESEKDEVVKQRIECRKLKKEKDRDSSKNSRSTTPVIMENVIDESESEKSGAHVADTTENPTVVEPSNDQSAFQFNVEDYIGSILNLGPDEMFHCSSGGSRLKQFFNNRESPVEERAGVECHSKRSPPPGRDSLSQLGSLIGFAEPVIRVPSPNSVLNSSHFFTPISPADKTSGGRGTGESLVEMLQKANSSNATTKKLPQPSVMPGSGRLPPPSVKDLIMGGKGQSLEEIEANLRRGRVGGGQVLNIGGLCNNTQFNQQHQHGFNTNKPPLSPHRPHQQQQQLHSQQNPFSDLLVKNGDVTSCAGPVGSKPSQPLLNNTNSENEFLAKLIRGGGGGVATNTGANMNNSSLLSLNVPPPRLPPNPITNLNLAPSHNLTPGNAPSLPQHSPSRSHLMPQQQPQHSSANNPDVFIKLMQNQQHKKHLLHPGFPQQQQHSQQPPHLDPIKQLLGGMNNMSLNSHHNQDISRDVHNLFQRVAAGQLTDSQLIAQLSSGNLTLNQREAVTTVLKLLSRHQNSPSLMPPRANLTPSPTPQAMMSGGLPLGNAASSISPRVASPNPDAASMLAPHMIQQTMFASGAPRRPPSHQELVVHAQSILQKALLKNELERAKEKHRKREAAERTRSPNPAPGISMQNGPSSVASLSMNRPNQDGSPTKGSKCQSPLVFTPISVLRKMTAVTAEKDRSEKDKHEGYGMSEMDKLRDSQNRLPNHQNTSTIHAGAMNLKNEKKSPLPPSGNSMLGPRAQMVMSGAQTTSMMHLNPHVLSNQRHLNLQQTMPLTRNPQQNMRVMQQNPQIIRTTMQQHMNNMNAHPAMHSRMQNPQNHVQNMSFGNCGTYKTGDNSLNVPKAVGSQNSSPINFMNFFGRDVLAKVQAGGMPELPGGKALSLEEVERQQTQAVPN